MKRLITFHLSGPICGCDEQSFSWSVGDGITIQCKTCKTSLHFPLNALVAGFELTTPYPGKKQEESEKKKLEVMDGGKVIEMPKKEDPN